MNTDAITVRFVGPYELCSEEADVLADCPYSRQGGIYFWAVQMPDDQYRISCIGITKRSFYHRTKEHIINQLGGLYGIYDAEAMRRGELKVLWGGLWGKGRLDKRVHRDLCDPVPPTKRGHRHGQLTVTDLQTRPKEVLDLTSLTLDEFQRLVPPFESTFQAHMALWCLDGQARTARRSTTYRNSPLPTPEERLLFILVYLKSYPFQVVHGRLFGRGQSKVHQWIYVLLAVLHATLDMLGDVPRRSPAELPQRLGVAEADATALAVPTTEAPTTADLSNLTLTSPLSAMMAPNGALSARKTCLSRCAVIAARTSATRA